MEWTPSSTVISTSWTRLVGTWTAWPPITGFGAIGMNSVTISPLSVACSP